MMGDLPEAEVDLRFLYWDDNIRILRRESPKWHRIVAATLNSSTSSPAEQLIAGLAVLCGSIARNSASSSVTEVCMNHMQRLLEDVEKKFDYSIQDIVLVSFAKFLLAFFSFDHFEKARYHRISKSAISSLSTSIRSNPETMEYGKLVMFMCSNRKRSEDQLIQRITASLFECSQMTRFDKRWFDRTRINLSAIMGMLNEQVLSAHPTLFAFARLFIVACDVALMDSPPIAASIPPAVASERPIESNPTIREEEHEEVREESTSSPQSEVKEETDDSPLLACTATASSSCEIKMGVDQVKLESDYETGDTARINTAGNLVQGEPAIVDEPQDESGEGALQLLDDVMEGETSSSAALFSSVTFRNDPLDLTKEEEEEEEEEEYELDEENDASSCSFETIEERELRKEVAIHENIRTPMMATANAEGGFCIKFNCSSTKRQPRNVRFHKLLARDGIWIESRELVIRSAIHNELAANRPTTSTELVIRSTTSLADISTGTLIALYVLCPNTGIMTRTVYGLIGERLPLRACDFAIATRRLGIVARRATAREREIVCGVGSGENVCGDGGGIEIVRSSSEIKRARDTFYASRVDVKDIVTSQSQRYQGPQWCDPFENSSRSIEKSTKSKSSMPTRTGVRNGEHSYSRGGVHPKAIKKSANILRKT